MNSFSRLEIIQKNANCKDVSDEVFFPDVESKGKATSLNNKYCGECPVKQLCFAHAYENEKEGIWAGTTKTDRKKMRQDEFVLREKYGYMLRHTWVKQIAVVAIEELISSERAKSIANTEDDEDEDQIA